MKTCLSPVFVACYDGNDAFIPEAWAHEAVQLLWENMVAAKLVNHDYNDEIQNYGDTIHTSKVSKPRIKRRTDDTAAASLVQAAEATDISVKLDQWFNQTFTLKSGEMSLAMVDLVDKHLAPCMKMMAASVDRVLLGRAASYFKTPAKRAGGLGILSADNAYETLVEADELMNVNKAPADGRVVILSPASKSKLLLSDKVVKALERGDNGKTMASAQIGHILGFDTFMAQNVSSVLIGADTVSGTVTAAHAAGSQDDQAATITSANAAAGEFVTVAGNDQPTWITAIDADSFTLNEVNKSATAAGAAAVAYKSCVTAAAYGAGYKEDITITGYTSGKAPQQGQLVAFGTTSATRKTYTVIEVVDSGTSAVILLDRPLEADVASGASVFPGPCGSFNVAMHPDFLTLVSRPLSVEHAAGIEFAMADIDGLGVRVAFQQVINQGLVVSVDLLAGVAVLDEDLYVPLLG